MYDWVQCVFLAFCIEKSSNGFCAELSSNGYLVFPKRPAMILLSMLLKSTSHGLALNSVFSDLKRCKFGEKYRHAVVFNWRVLRKRRMRWKSSAHVGLWQ